MERRTFDLLASLGGLALAIVLLVVGVLFKQNADYAKTTVKDQLEVQQIFFPPREALSEEELDQPNLPQYAGEQLSDGEMARVYADEFIALHLAESTDGRTYAQLSTESRENPDDEELKGLVQTAFRGETLRGILLTSYAFWQLGVKADQMALVMFVGAGLFLILAVLGLLHYQRTPRGVELAP